MALVFAAPEAGTGMTEVATEFRVFGEGREALFKVSHVAVGPVRTEVGDGVARNGLHGDERIAG